MGLHGKLILFRSFYLQWTDGQISVGRSSSDIIVVWPDSDPMIVVEIKLFTLDTDGYWTFNNVMGA